MSMLLIFFSKGKPLNKRPLSVIIYDEMPSNLSNICSNCFLDYYYFCKFVKTPLELNPLQAVYPKPYKKCSDIFRENIPHKYHQNSMSSPLSNIVDERKLKICKNVQK